MSELKIVQGSDYGPINIVTMDDNGLPIPISSLSDYQCYIYQVSDLNKKKNLFNYKMTPVGNDYPIIASGNTQSISLSKEQTATILGDLYIECVVILPSSTTFPAGQKVGTNSFLLEVTSSPNPRAL